MGNITLGQKASLLWAVNAGRFFQTAGLFLLGFYIGRKQLFVSSEKNLRFWTKTLIVAAIAFAPLYTLKELIMQNDAIVQQSAGTVFDMWQKLAFTLVLVASFILLYQNKKVQQRRRKPAFLWQNELDELYHPVHHRSAHLFPDRSLSGSVLRIYGQPADWVRHFPAASEVLQMVVVRI